MHLSHTCARAHTHTHASSPGVEVGLCCPSYSSSASPTALLQAQFSKDANQYHDGHHPTDDVHDKLRAVPVQVSLSLSNGGNWFASVCPDGSVIVGADVLVQALLTELAAETVEAGTAAVQEDTGVTVERWVPLTHDIIVTLATCPTSRREILIICISTTVGSGKPCLWRSVLGGLCIAGSCLVSQCGR